MWHLHFGVNWAALSYASWLLFWLSILATALYVGVMLLLESVGVFKSRATGADIFPETLKQHASIARAKKIVNEWAPYIAIFVVGYVLGSASLFCPVRELHRVEVTGKLSDRVYTVIIPAEWNPPAKADRAEVFRLCKEGDDLPLIRGMVIEPFQYIQGTDCLLINESTYVDWLRNKNNDVVDRNGRVLFAEEN